MKKTSVILILFLFFFLQAGAVLADKEQLQFNIQKAKTDIETGQKKSEEAKLSVTELQKARELIKQAENTLEKNKNWRGALNKEAEPLIAYYTEMAEIYTAIALSRLGKNDQEKENARLEKLIPEIEAKIKVFDDKNAEIKKLREELEKPQGKIRDVNSEIAKLQKEKAELTEKAAQLKSENEKSAGKIETLNEVVVSVRKDLTEKIKTVENLSLENKLLQDNIKSVEAQKGGNLLELQTKLNFFETISKFGFLSRTAGNECTFIVPRNKLIKATGKSIVLNAEADRFITEIAESIKSFPAGKMAVKVHGFGKPSTTEDAKSTAAMANLVKKAFAGKGINESAIEASGAGTAAPLFSKSAAEENRRVEITISNMTVKK